jgi:hypothetical protein
LFHPLLKDEHFESIKNGNKIPPETKSQLQIGWTEEEASEVAQYVEEWIKTGDFVHLANLLKAYPASIGAQLIYHQIFHLTRLLSYSSEEDFDEYGCGSLREGQEDFLPYGAKRQIRETLQSLLSAWISRMLPGYSLQPVPRHSKKGPPRQLQLHELYDLLSDFLRLLERYEIIIESNVASDRRKRGETNSAFCHRIAEIVQTLHLSTVYSLETFRDKSIPLSPDQKKGIEVLAGLRSRSVRLKDDVALSIAGRSIGKKGKVRKRKLLYLLLSIHHPYLKKRQSIRGQIYRAECAFPDEVKEAKLRRKKRLAESRSRM